MPEPNTRELKHTFVNKLGAIAGLLNLKAGEADDAERQALTESAFRVQAMAIALHHLSLDDGQVALGSYTRDLARRICGRRRAIVETAPLSMPLEEAVTLGLLLTELLIARLRVSPGRSRITVRLTTSDEAGRLDVEDPGPAPPTDYLSDIESPLEAIVLLDLTAQLGGELEFQSGATTTFTLRFPQSEATSNA